MIDPKNLMTKGNMSLESLAKTNQSLNLESLSQDQRQRQAQNPSPTPTPLRLRRAGRPRLNQSRERLFIWMHQDLCAAMFALKPGLLKSTGAKKYGALSAYIESL